MKCNTQNIIYLLWLAFLLIWGAGCNSGSHRKNADRDREKSDYDLPQIRENGTLRVITTYNTTSYFLYRGEPMGYEYEMVERLAKSLDLKLEVVVAKKFEEVFDLLKEGKGDLIAFGLTITEDRKEILDFTDYLYTTHQVLVQRKPSNWRSLPAYRVRSQLLEDPFELIGDTIYVGAGTSYIQRLKNLGEEVGGPIYVEELDGDYTTDDIIKKVVDGEIKYTVADYNLATVNKNYYPILDIHMNVSLSQRIAWGVRKNAPMLLRSVNDWIRKSKKEQFYYTLYDKYFEDQEGYRVRVSSDLFSKYSGKISPYDSLVRVYSEKIGWDWRLVSSVIFQESQFDRRTTGHLGSGGLMQLMPETASELGVQDLNNPGENIRAGTIYLQLMYNQLAEVKDSLQRIKFTLAAYNSGLGHVFDAQRLAESLGDDPNVWDDHVENAMLKLGRSKYYTRPEVRHGIVRGVIPYNYVRQVFQRYERYKDLILTNENLLTEK